MPSPTVADTDHASDPLVAEYLRLGLAFDRLERGFVDAYTGDPALKAEVENAPAPDPARLADRARGLLADLPGALDALLATPETAAESLSGHYGFVIHEMAEARERELRGLN